ncbi:AsnC family transcriptional regulator [Haloarcula nitratireducens]|uniref:AsnC family transcriptional regulator n=1 Tax=Haloarcula nitratireducens TaxID=2487749 RepID=A0AAW4P8F4_9EURY|nr:AsnC family transcriptional regulator [Halomicroarcula nitratireducens]MBX0293950.1 AsnC family transcriptional regulator [Halomicroarcula nitratireducens]
MRGLDDTDREILRLLLADARRPFSDIAEQVDLSAPAVSDRVDRLSEMGVIRGFTVDVDRSLLHSGVPVLVEIDAEPGRAGAIRDALADVEAVEHVFRTADSRVTLTATVPQSAVPSFLDSHLDFEDVQRYDVRLVADTEWTPGLGTADFAPDCAECGNTVDEEGVRSTLDGDPYYFCCGSCEARFVEQYETLKEEA